jgi:branched-chain amino acid aminotransferase
MEATKYIWHRGRLVPWQDATVHVLAHVMHYGSSVFEGIRAYNTRPHGTAIFRLGAHLRRLYDSARIYHMDIPHDEAELKTACWDVVRENGLEAAYIRPLVYRGFGSLGVGAIDKCPVEVAVAAYKWGAFLGAESLDRGVDVGVSSWRRVAPDTLPAMAKAGGNYLSSQLMIHEARRHGYAEAIALDAFGYLSEGAAENVFLVRDEVIYTPVQASAMLPGITRDTVITLARHLGYTVREELLTRESLYLADEVFFSGTAVEIAAVRSVDGLQVGKGGRGPVTRRVQEAFFGLFDGSTEDAWGWLEPVPAAVAR